MSTKNVEIDQEDSFDNYEVVGLEDVESEMASSDRSLTKATSDESKSNESSDDEVEESKQTIDEEEKEVDLDLDGLAESKETDFKETETFKMIRRTSQGKLQK